MASFQTLSNGHTQARVRRKGKDSSQVFITLAEAKAWAKKEEKRIDSALAGRGNVNAQTFTIGDAVAFYFEEHIQHKKSAKEYKYVFLSLPSYIVRERLALAGREQAEKWVKEMRDEGLNPATIARRVGMVRAGVNYATTHEVALHGMPNPYKGLKLPALPRSASRTRTATDDELNEFYARISKRSKHLIDYILLALETASRRGELVKARWEDVNFENSTLYLEDTKNSESRHVPLSASALNVLKKRKEDPKNAGEYVFTSQTKSARGGHIQPATISKAFRRVRAEIEKDKKTKLNLRLHDLRHTAATRWHADFKNPLDLMSITGHKDIRSLGRYVNNKAEEIAQKMREKRPDLDN